MKYINPLPFLLAAFLVSMVGLNSAAAQTMGLQAKTEQISALQRPWQI